MTPIPRRAAPLSPPAAALTAAASGGLSRRGLLGAGVAAGAGLALTGCAPPPPPSGGASSLVLPQDVSASEKTLKWANWTAYLDLNGKETEVSDARGLHEAVGDRGQLQRGRRRQRLLLRQGRPAAAGRSEHRPRHLHADGLDGGAGDPRPAVPAAGADPDAQRRQQPAPAAQGRLLRPRPHALDHLAERLRGDRLQQGQGRPRAQDARRPLGRRPQGRDRRALGVPRHGRAW